MGSVRTTGLKHKPFGGETARSSAPPNEREIASMLMTADLAAIVSAVGRWKMHPDDIRQNSLTALAVAISSCDAMTVKNLLEWGADPNLVTDPSYLHMAINERDKNGQSLDILRSLLAHGANPAIREGRGSTPLHFASGTNAASPCMVAALLESGRIDPDVRDCDGLTPSLLALENPSETARAILVVLLSHGASRDVSSPSGKTLVEAAAAAGIDLSSI